MATAKNLECTQDEIQLLQEMLNGDQSRLLMEIAHTDTREYKEYLIKRQEVLEGFIRKIG